jgi:hypothetical protein
MVAFRQSSAFCTVVELPLFLCRGFVEDYEELYLKHELIKPDSVVVVERDC